MRETLKIRSLTTKRSKKPTNVRRMRLSDGPGRVRLSADDVANLPQSRTIKVRATGGAASATSDQFGLFDIVDVEFRSALGKVTRLTTTMPPPVKDYDTRVERLVYELAHRKYG